MQGQPDPYQMPGNPAPYTPNPIYQNFEPQPQVTPAISDQQTHSKKPNRILKITCLLLVLIGLIAGAAIAISSAGASSKVEPIQQAEIVKELITTEGENEDVYYYHTFNYDVVGNKLKMKITITPEDASKG